MLIVWCILLELQTCTIRVIRYEVCVFYDWFRVLLISRLLVLYLFVMFLVGFCFVFYCCILLCLCLLNYLVVLIMYLFVCVLFCCLCWFGLIWLFLRRFGFCCHVLLVFACVWLVFWVLISVTSICLFELFTTFSRLNLT